MDHVAAEREVTRRIEVPVVLDCGETDLATIFGSPDDMKFRSSMTLFALADESAANLFEAALTKFADGVRDDRTLAILAP